MIDVKNLNIWKNEDNKVRTENMFLNASVDDLNLGVRSYNCLKRAGCNTVQDILDYMGEDGLGLRKIRNLGARSEMEITEKLAELKQEYRNYSNRESQKKVTIIRPAKRIWDMEIEEFGLSLYTKNRLKACGIVRVGDLYKANVTNEPGWYAVRELFEKIPSSR